MQILNVEKSDKVLVGRTEVLAEIGFEKETPSRKEVIKAIASQLKVKPELIVVKKITTRFGEPKAKVLAHVYESEKDLKEMASAVYLDRASPKKKSEEAPAAPVEEKKKA